MTIIGTTYFLIEIVIICGLSYVELNVATRNKEKQIEQLNFQIHDLQDQFQKQINHQV